MIVERQIDDGEEAHALLILAAAAKAWWESKRPIGFTTAQHLANPTINCTGDLGPAQALALAVAVCVRLGVTT